MSSCEDELRTKWGQINFYDGGALQLSVAHVLEWYVRYVSAAQKSLVVLTGIPAINLESSRCIEADCNQRKDGKYAVSFTLLDNSKEDVFITMAADIIGDSASEVDAAHAIRRVQKRYSAWLRLLDHKHSTLLSINEQKGLSAELLFLRDTIQHGLPAADAVAGWVGPDGADQDFVYEDGWHEIKATGASSTKVTISSVEQLDCSDVGELVVNRIDKCAPAHVGAFTLYALVHSMIDIISSEMNVLDDFVLRLGAAGYIDSLEYDKQALVCSAVKRYTVNKSFPRLIRSDLPPAIVNAEYQIDLPSIEAWAK